ncbi:hypothetical protein ACHAWF_002004 [Thalassiosira exigua]
MTSTPASEERPSEPPTNCVGNPFAALNDDLIHRFATFLAPVDLARVAWTCRRFGGKPTRVEKKKKKRTSSLPRWRNRKRKRCPNVGRTNGNNAAIPQPQLSLMEEVARKQIEEIKTDAWKDEWSGSDAWKLANRRGNESWFAVYSALRLMHTSLVFSHFLGKDVMYFKRNPTVIQARTKFFGCFSSCVACHDVMTEGTHYAEFTCVREGYVTPGIIRPALDSYGWRVNYDEYPGNDQYFFNDNRISRSGDVVGLLLDLHEGTLSVYKNGKCLGIQRGGLYGSYRWAAEVPNYPPGWEKSRVALKIDRAPLPDQR